MQVDKESPWFLSYVVIASAIAAGAVHWLFNDRTIEWSMVVLLTAAVGAIGDVVRWNAWPLGT